MYVKIYCLKAWTLILFDHQSILYWVMIDQEQLQAVFVSSGPVVKTKLFSMQMSFKGIELFDVAVGPILIVALLLFFDFFNDHELAHFRQMKPHSEIWSNFKNKKNFEFAMAKYQLII